VDARVPQVSGKTLDRRDYCPINGGRCTTHTGSSYGSVSACAGCWSRLIFRQASSAFSFRKSPVPPGRSSLWLWHGWWLC